MKKKLLSLFLAAVIILLPKITKAAGIYLNAPVKTVGIGANVTVEVRINTDGQSINAVEANVSYPAADFDFVRATPGSIFNIQSPGAPLGGNGAVFFSAGVPNGYTGASGLIGSFVLRAKNQTTASLAILSAKALLNDGHGTNALSGVTGTRITVLAAAVAAPVVISSTHPDPQKWYPVNNLELSWDRPQGVYGYSFELNQIADTVPDNTLDTTVTTQQSYPNLKDGVWYFHIKARGKNNNDFFSETAHYRAQLDLTPPQPFDLKLVGENNVQDATRTPTISFETTDAASGIDFAEIFLDGKLIDKTTALQYSYAKSAPGPHVLKAVVYDRAGNYAKSEIAVIMNEPQSPIEQVGYLNKTFELPMYWLLLMNALILLLIILVLVLMFKKAKYVMVYPPIAEITKEFDSDIDKLREHISNELNNAVTPQNSDFNREEKKVAEDIAKNLERAKQSINKRLEDLSIKSRNIN